MFSELMTWSFLFLYYDNLKKKKKRIHDSIFRVFKSSNMLHLFHIYKFLSLSTMIKIFYLFTSFFNYSWNFVACFCKWDVSSIQVSQAQILQTLYTGGNDGSYFHLKKLDMKIRERYTRLVIQSVIKPIIKENLCNIFCISHQRKSEQSSLSYWWF